MVAVDYSWLQQVTECLQWVIGGYSMLEKITAGYRVATVGYSRLQQATEWLQWIRAGYSRLPSGYSGLQ